MSWVWHNKKSSHREPDWNAPLPENHQARLEYLYAWERRCRGYDLHLYPVALEPSFLPYRPGTPYDSDTPFGFTPPAQQLVAGSLSHITLQLPVEQKVTLSATSGFLSALPFASAPLAFEIFATEDEIAYQLTCQHEAAPGILAAARMHWPHGAFDESEDYLRRSLNPELFETLPNGALKHEAALNEDAFMVEFGLQQFAFLPLVCPESFAVDPLGGVIVALGTLAPNEIAGLQILFTPAARRWNDALREVASEFDDSAEAGREQSLHRHPALANPLVRAAESKLAHPLYAAVIRVFALSGEGQSRAFALCKQIGGALGTFNAAASQSGNALLALANQDPHSAVGLAFPANGLLRTVFERTSHRSGLLLSLPELVGLVHPPGESVQHPKLLRHDPRARSLSDELLNAEGVTIGLHPYQNREQKLVWPDAYRNRHAYLLGATRMGKSTLLLNLITQDIARGGGLCLIDPHGDLAHDVLARIPQERVGDVLYLDLSDREYPLAPGLLEASTEHERRLLCSELLSVLKRLFASSWGDRLEHILRHAILTLLAAGGNSATPYTLRDIRPLLSNKAFRERVVASLDDHDLQAFWSGEFGGYSPATFAPLYNKLGLLLSSPLVRNIIAGRQSKLSFADVIHQKQILLVNLAGSQIGSDQSHFLGALLVSKLQIAAMQSLRLGIAERTPFTLYVDEFQNFVVSSFETILSEAGKAGLSLVMANQFLEQLSSQLQTTILSNAGTLCSFRVSSDSRRLLEKEFAGRYKSHELVSLNRGEAIARVGSAADSYDIKTLPPPPVAGENWSDFIRYSSRERICRPREDVEAELSADARRHTEELEALEQAEKEAKEKTKKPIKTPPKTDRQAEVKAVEAKAAVSIPIDEEKTDEGVPIISDEKLGAMSKENKTSTDAIDPAQPLLEPDCFGVPEP